MALLYNFRGDSPNNFWIITDGARSLSPTNVAQTQEDFHITELRNLSDFDVVNGMDFEVLETTRNTIVTAAQDHGYELIEFDDDDLLGTVYSPPRISTYSPARGGTAGAITDNIVLTFTENIAKAASTGPTVVLFNLTSNAIVETFEFDATEIIVAGAAATINPTASLVTGNEYALLINNGYFTNVGATEDHGGIRAQDFYNFTAP